VFTPLSGILNSILRENANKENTQGISNSGSPSPSFSDFSESESEDYILEGENENKYFELTQKYTAKPMMTWYWNGNRWAEAEDISISRKFYKKEFTIISWNIWFGLRNREGRMEALCKVVREYDPDFIAFQEVTPDLLKMILSERWLRQYFLTDFDGRTLDTYGNVIFSKVKFHEISVTQLESRMGRKAILSNFLVKGANPFIFGTFHLESHLEDGLIRARQLQTFRDLTQNCPNIVLVGDTNFTSDHEAVTLGPRFRDTWRELYQVTPSEEKKNPGLTFDTSNNEMAKEERDDLKQLRLDRCFYSGETIEPLEMKILGQEPYFKNEWISDNYGIMVKLRLKD